MIKLKTILSELAESDIQRLLKRIKNKEFRFLAQGDNGRVYEIDNEDKVFKVTQEHSEFEVATVIVGRHTQFTTFIPVYYVNEIENGILPGSSYIMAKANKLNRNMQNNIIQFTDAFKRYAQEMGGEITIFDYLDNDGARDADTQLVNFLRALQQDIQKMNIPDLDLDLDFGVNNVMVWNGNMVLTDW